MSEKKRSPWTEEELRQVIREAMEKLNISTMPTGKQLKSLGCTAALSAMHRMGYGLKQMAIDMRIPFHSSGATGRSEPSAKKMQKLYSDYPCGRCNCFYAANNLKFYMCSSMCEAYVTWFRRAWNEECGKLKRK